MRFLRRLGWFARRKTNYFIASEDRKIKGAEAVFKDIFTDRQTPTGLSNRAKSAA
jgi:hypothetical protein